MYLPGTIHERIGDLRTSKGLQQKELAELVGISPSQVSRIETGESKNITADTIAKLAKALNVSADYILGLTTVSIPKNYDISELGLSEGAVKNLLRIKIADGTSVVNRLLAHKSFPTLIYQIKSYFHDEMAMGVMGRNELFGMATASLEDLRKEQPEKSGEIREATRFINAEKFGKHEIDIEKIKNTFMAILRDIKKDIDSGEPEATTVMTDMMQQIQALLPEKETATPENLAEVVTMQLAQSGIFDDSSMETLQSSLTDILEQVRKATEETGSENT